MMAKNHMYQKYIRYLEVDSKLLKGFPLIASSKRHLPILLPPNFSEGKKYPTIWMLDGYLGTGRSLMSESGFLGESLGSQLHRLMSEDILPECIFAFPDPTTRFGGSQFINSTVCGPFMQHLIEELIPLVDSSLNTIANPMGRVICGHSSGGFGALLVSMLQPNYFSYCIASAADSAFDLSMSASFPLAAMRFKKYNGEEGFLKYFFALPRPEKCSKEDFHAFMTIAMGTCYSPNPNRPGVWCDLPFDPETCTLIPEIWQKWLSFDPVQLIPSHIPALKKLKWLHLDCGTEDEFCAQFGHRRMSKILNDHGVEHYFSEFAGGHSGTSARWEHRFKELAPALRSFSAR